MGRLLFTCLLVAGLLACPLRCFSCQTGGMAEASDAPDACSCCSNSQDNKQPSDDQPLPGDDCSCPDCLCDGATLPVDPEVPKASDCIALANWIVATRDHLLGAMLFSRIDAKDRPLSVLGARDALVVYQAWLI